LVCRIFFFHAPFTVAPSFRACYLSFSSLAIGTADGSRSLPLVNAGTGAVSPGADQVVDTRTNRAAPRVLAVETLAASGASDPRPRAACVHIPRRAGTARSVIARIERNEPWFVVVFFFHVLFLDSNEWGSFLSERPSPPRRGRFPSLPLLYQTRNHRRIVERAG
jgi:hypothetical protein